MEMRISEVATVSRLIPLPSLWGAPFGVRDPNDERIKMIEILRSNGISVYLLPRGRLFYEEDIKHCYPI